MIKLKDLKEYIPKDSLNPEEATRALHQGSNVYLHKPGDIYHGQQVLTIQIIERTKLGEPRESFFQVSAVIHVSEDLKEKLKHEALQNGVYADTQAEVVDQELEEIENTEHLRVPLGRFSNGRFYFTTIRPVP